MGVFEFSLQNSLVRDKNSTLLYVPNHFFLCPFFFFIAHRAVDCSSALMATFKTVSPCFRRLSSSLLPSRCRWCLTGWCATQRSTVPGSIVQCIRPRPSPQPGNSSRVNPYPAIFCACVILQANASALSLTSTVPQWEVIGTLMMKAVVADGGRGFVLEALAFVVKRGLGLLGR